MRLTWSRLTAHTRHAFRIARSGSSTSGNDVHRIIVAIEHDGLTGYGEAAPSVYYKQSLDTVENTLRQSGPLLGDNPFQIDPILKRLCARFDDQRATVAAIDEALHDWVGKRLGVPVWRLLGLDRSTTPPTSMTIGLPPDDIESPAAYLRERVAEIKGFQILKIKIGTSRDHDNLEAIRSAAPTLALRVDANCGWTPAEAEARIRSLSSFGPEFVEQPIPAGKLDVLRELRRSSPIPIFVDEDSERPGDAIKLAGVVDGINIKLSKCGGIREGLRMIHLARAVGLKIMLGCMVETSLGISAAAQLASLVDYVDLDGHLLLADDPFAGLELRDGRVLPPDRPGLGIEVEPAIAKSE